MLPRDPNTDAFGRDHATRDARARAVLEGAFWLLVRHGWAPPLDPYLDRDVKRPKDALDLLRAMYASAEPSDLGVLDTWNARAVLSRFGWEPFWERTPLRSSTDVFELLRKAIRMLGAIPPSLPIPKRENKGRGGWAISSGPGAL